MIIQRETQIKRLRQKEYRQQLYNSVKQQKMQKSKSKFQESSYPKQTFSLIKNIDDEKERRKNKQKQYYIQLQKQRQQQRQKKKKKQQQQKIKQLQLENKIKKEKQLLQKKFNQQLTKQQNKKNITTSNINQNILKKQKIKTQKNDQNNKLKTKFPQDSLDHLRDQNQIQQNKMAMSRQLSQLQPAFTYQSRFQNQQYNFPERRLISNNHYRQLQLEKRKLQDQANSLRQLNRYLGNQKNYTKKRNQGLQSLKEVQDMLDHQNANLQQQYTNKRQYYVNGYRTSTQNLVMDGYRNF